jgi:hypothetical protein
MTTAERIQQIADRASLTAQHRQHVQDQQRLVDFETQVQEAENKSEEVDEELRRRNPFAGRRRRKKNGQQSSSTDTKSRTFYNAREQAQVVDDEENHNLDIIV